MIAFATRHFGPATRPNLRFEVADVRRLTYREEFDRVVSFNALHWVPEQGAALRSSLALIVPWNSSTRQSRGDPAFAVP